MKILNTLLSKHKHRQSGFTFIGAIIALILFLLFVAGLILVALKIIETLNRLFPCNPSGITQYVPSGTYYANSCYYTYSGYYTNDVTLSGSPHTIGFSDDGISWNFVAEVVCFEDEIDGIIQQFIDDDIANSTNDIVVGFYNVITNGLLNNINQFTNIYQGPVLLWNPVDRIQN